MNEQIYKIAKQADTLARVIEPDLREIVRYNRIRDEKFAELIVLECVKFCEHESNDDEHDEYDMGMWVKAESIKTAIKEHFGVEE